MSVTTFLEVYVLSENMTQKATAANTAIQALEKAMAYKLALDTSAATTPGDDVTIPFTNTSDVSAREALRMIYLDLTAGATAAFNVIHPNNMHLFFCKNNTTQIATVKTAAGTGIDVLPGESRFLYCDGTNVVAFDPSQLASLWLYAGSSGSSAPNSASDDFVIETPGDGGMSILTPDGNYGRITFGSPTDVTGALIRYKQTLGILALGTTITGGQLQFLVDASTEAMRLDASGNMGIGVTGPSTKLQVAGAIRNSPTTVASLPSASTVGAGSRHYVLDSTATMAAGIGTTVTGGGSNGVPVYSDGTNWLIG